MALKEAAAVQQERGRGWEREGRQGKANEEGRKMPHHFSASSGGGGGSRVGERPEPWRERRASNGEG